MLPLFLFGILYEQEMRKNGELLDFGPPDVKVVIGAIIFWVLLFTGCWVVVEYL